MRGALLLLLAIDLGCQASEAQPPPPGPPPVPAPVRPPAQVDEHPSPRFERDMVVRFHMHESFDLLRATERLLIRGKLEDAKQLALSIGAAEDPPGLAPWAAYSARVRERAVALGNAPSLEDAVQRQAALAAACADCHVASGAMPELAPYPAAPLDQDTLDARMARHVWAADRLWEGIVTGVPEPWAAGLEVLAQAPLASMQTTKQRAALAKQLQRLASQARRTRLADPEARAKVYGELLTVCTGCHTSSSTSSSTTSR